LVENNGYGLSTPSNEQFRQKQFIDKGIGYGIKTKQVDGNNILEVYSAVSEIAEEIRKDPKPYLLECLTFRMRGHEEASGTKYVPQHLFDEWEKKDPISNFEKWLLQEGLMNGGEMDEIRTEIKAEIESGLEEVFAQPEIEADTQEELNDVYFQTKYEEITPASGNHSEKRLIDAISDGLRQSMEVHPDLVLMGQDIAEYGGVFKITDGFVEQFGKDRVRNTPICESAIVGAAYGLVIKGKKAMVEMQFADFVSCGFNQIVNNLAKSNYRWAQPADVVIRMPTGAGVGAGPFHSQSNEAWFYKVPGLKIVYPSNPYDAKGLLCQSFNDPNPVMFFEHKNLYRSLKQDVPDDYYTIPFGKAKTVNSGNDITIIAYGWAVHWAKEVTDENNLSAEILDLRTLIPWDQEAVVEAVKKTGKVIIVHEDTLTGGIGAELAAWISEHCFQFLDAPVKRVGSLDTPVPLAKSLEENFLAKSQLHSAIQTLLNY